MNRSLRPSLRLLCALSLLAMALCSSCGESGQLEDASRQLRFGNLDQADSLLEGTSSDAALKLREQIAEVRRARVELGGRLDELRAGEPDVEQLELERLLEKTEDPVAIDRIERAISRSVDRLAELRSESGRKARSAGSSLAKAAPPKPEPPRKRAPEPHEAAVDANGLDAARDAVGARMADQHWAHALAELEMVLPVAGDRVEEFRALRRQVQERAEAEVVVLLAAAEQDDQAGKPGRARDLLREAAPRFRASGSGAPLHEALRDLEGRLEIIALSDEVEVAEGRAATPARSSADPAQRAAALERGGDLAGALDAYLEASLHALLGVERSGLHRRCLAIERRLLMRAEILAARAIAPEDWSAEFGLVGGDSTHLQLSHGLVSWGDWGLAKLKRAASKAKLSQEAQLGLLAERFERGDTAGQRGALAKLARFMEDGVVSQADAWALVAEQRGEAVPEGGYVWVRGAWIGKRARLDTQRAEVLTALEGQFNKARSLDDCDTAWAALIELGADAKPRLVPLLEARWEEALDAVRKGGTLRTLERVAQDREELDRRRSEALALIFDEEQYFYPYQPPECPPEQARLYGPVQRRVDELVEALQAVWGSGKPAKLGAGFRESLAELGWLRAHAKQQGLQLELTEDLPAWLLFIPAELDAVGLREFAWDHAESLDLAYNRTVLAFNERRWAKSKSFTDEETASRSEQRQVTITNEYRMMFGRRVVAWNPDLQIASSMHSEYMARTGDFGHFEKGDPERRSPFDRMRLAGYNMGASENCHMGSGSPEGAHGGWIRSSGHHRNLLMSGHREMASAQVSSYWTQNFGTGTAFLAELDSW